MERRHLEVATTCGGRDIIPGENMNEDSDENHELHGLGGFCLAVMVSLCLGLGLSRARPTRWQAQVG